MKHYTLLKHNATNIIEVSQCLETLHLNLFVFVRDWKKLRKSKQVLYEIKSFFSVLKDSLGERLKTLAAGGVYMQQSVGASRQLA